MRRRGHQLEVNRESRCGIIPKTLIHLLTVLINHNLMAE